MLIKILTGNKKNVIIIRQQKKYTEFKELIFFLLFLKKEFRNYNVLLLHMFTFYLILYMG